MAETETRSPDTATIPGERRTSEVARTAVSFGAAGAPPAGELSVMRFGTAGARPKVYLQAGLHADELPGMLVLRSLAARLEEVAARGEIIGEVVIVPVSNPLGLSQLHHGYLQGRFDEATGENFNRGYADLSEMVLDALAGKLGPDPVANVDAIRGAMAEAVARLTPETPVAGLRKAVLGLAYDADIVLDLHADNEALVHVYTAPAFWPEAEDLAAELDARAVLLCELSGGNPFDEACSAPWWALAAAFPETPVPNACFAATVELRSNNEVEAGLVEGDSAALLRFLMRRGVVAGDPGNQPRLLCEATPLNGMQQLRAPARGIITYRARLGDHVRQGDVIAAVTDPLGESIEVMASTDGTFFARQEQRYAWPGKVIGKIAGAIPLPDRTGALLTE